MSVIADPVDRLVTAMLLDALTGVDLTRPKTSGTDSAKTQTVIDNAEARLKSLAEDYGEELITRAEYLAARQVTETRLRRAQAQQTATTRNPALEGIPSDPAKLTAAWNTWPLERQRAVLSAVIDHVVVGPAAYRGRPTFDPDRVKVVWRV